MRQMAFIEGKSTGWSGPLDDFIQELQETPLRVKLIAELTMNSSLTTSVCPWDIPINCVSMEHYQSAIEEKTEAENFKERKGLGEIRQTDSEVLEKECPHSFLKQNQWNTNTSSKCVCHSSSLKGTSHFPETDHTHKQFITVSFKKEEFLSLFQKKDLVLTLWCHPHHTHENTVTMM